MLLRLHVCGGQNKLGGLTSTTESEERGETKLAYHLHQQYSTLCRRKVSYIELKHTGVIRGVLKGNAKPQAFCNRTLNLHSS